MIYLDNGATSFHKPESVHKAVAHAMRHCANPGRGGYDAAKQAAFFDVAQAIWQGYNAVSPLTEAEKQALPDMVIAIQMICVAAFSGTEKFAELAGINQRMLRMMLEKEEKLKANW